VYITGQTYGSLDGTTAGGIDAFLTKYDQDGTIQWTKQLGTSAYDVANGVSVDSNNNVYITGYTGGSLDGSTAGGLDAFLTKYDQDGTKQWTKQLGTSANDAAYGVSTDSDNNVYITGTTGGSLDGTTFGGSDAFLTKYADDGTKQWTKQLGSSSTDIPKGVAIAIGMVNSVFATGETYTVDTFASKLSTDLVRTVTYGEDSDLTDGTTTFRPYIEFTDAVNLSGLPLTIFDVTSSSVSIPTGGQLDFRYINAEDTITITDTTNNKSVVISPGDYFVHDFIHKLETDLAQSLSYDGTNIIFEGITGATSINITITTNDTSIFGISSKTLSSGDNTLPFITYGQPEP
jgi:hypothetical protein